MGQTVRRRTKQEEKDLSKFVTDIEALEIENMVRKRVWDTMPVGWLSAHQDAPCGPVKTKMTIRMDTDVLEWYRALGMGYQNRINTVLRAYKNAVTSKWIEMDEDKDVSGDFL